MPTEKVDQVKANNNDPAVAQDRAAAAKLVEEAQNRGEVEGVGEGSGNGVYWVFGGLAAACIIGELIHSK